MKVFYRRVFHVLVLICLTLLSLPSWALAPLDPGSIVTEEISTHNWQGYVVEDPTVITSLQADKNGTGHYSYPIAIPVARLMPSLALTYNTRTKSSWHLADGWSFSGGLQITRPTDRESRSATPSDEFYISGDISGKLVPDGSGDYKLQGVDTVTVKAERLGTAPATTWRVTHSNGLVYELVPGDIGATKAVGPEVWVVSKIMGPSGNQVDYTYGANYQLLHIDYGGVSPATHFLKVEFDYAVRSHDVTSWRAGFEKINDLYLTDIVVKVNGTSVWEYRLNVTDSHGHPILDSIQKSNYNSSGAKQAEPLVTLTYTGYDKTAYDEQTVSGLDADVTKGVEGVAAVNYTTVHSEHHASVSHRDYIHERVQIVE